MAFSDAYFSTETYKQTGPVCFSPDARFLAVAVDYRLVVRDVVSLKVPGPRVSAPPPFHPPTHPPLFSPPVSVLGARNAGVGWISPVRSGRRIWSDPVLLDHGGHELCVFLFDPKPWRSGIRTSLCSSQFTAHFGWYKGVDNTRFCSLREI
jgi:hypothetical protein